VCRLGSTIARLKLKEIGGNSHKRWIMRFNSTLSEEPHQGLKSSCKLQKRSRLRGCWTGAARLSSARHVNLHSHPYVVTYRCNQLISGKPLEKWAIPREVIYSNFWKEKDLSEEVAGG